MRSMSQRTVIPLLGILIIGWGLAGSASAGTGPGRYEKLTAGAEPVRIPFRMLNGKPLLDLEINGRKAALMIDNGVLWDQVWLFGSPLAAELGLKPLDTAAIQGAGEGDPTSAFASNPLMLRFSDIVFYDQPVLVSPPAAGFAKMFPGADGQLSKTFFGHFVVEFDFVRSEVLLHDPEGFRFGGKGCVLDMEANASGTYSVPVSLKMLDGKAYVGRVDLDFGGIYPLKIALNNKHAIRLPAGVKERASFGAQGKSSEYSGKIESLKIGPYEFPNMTAVFGDERTSRIHPDNLGVIGLPLFQKFRAVFDYFGNRLFLEPNKNFGVPFG